MISFVTLILGLAFGTRPIEMSAAPDVSSIEFLLDGRTYKTLDAPPWKLFVDLGPPMPHELLAVARDASGAEIGRAVQHVNLPRGTSEAFFTLLPGDGGTGRAAALTYASSRSDLPEGVDVTFDGTKLDSGSFARIRLPDFRPADVHVLRAELKFRGEEAATAELLVGGVRRESPDGPETLRGETRAELTAVPAVFRGKPPAASRMAGWFHADGRPTRVEAVEEIPGDIVVVMDDGAKPWLQALRRRLFAPPVYRYTLEDGQRVRFCWPATLPARESASGYDVFMRSGDFTRRWDLHRLLVSADAPPCEGAPRLVDATTVAALSAASGNRPRAVVLLLAGTEDASHVSAGDARAFLRALRVPLRVWTRTKETGAAWGDRRVIESTSDLHSAVSELTASVAKQRIVWLEGRHLPQSISLSPQAKGVSLVE